MPSEKAKQRAGTGAGFTRDRARWADIVEIEAARPKDPRLRLIYPLASRKVLNWGEQDVGNTAETQLTVESVGGNGVKRVVDALLRLTTTDRVVEGILTIHTQLFAHYQDPIPAFKFLQTFIFDELRGIAEAGCCKGELFVTIVDETGVYRSPVAEVKTFL